VRLFDCDEEELLTAKDAKVAEKGKSF